MATSNTPSTTLTKPRPSKSTEGKGRPYIKIKEIGEDVRQQRHTEERGNILQQVQNEGEGHSDLSQISGQDTKRSAKAENSLQGVRTDIKKEP